MKRLFPLIIASLTCLAVIAKTLSAPDFAYPRTVRDDASARLQSALDAHRDVEAIRAAADLFLAETALDPELTPSALHRLDSVRTLLSPAPAAVTALLEAEIYTQLYNERRWIYDSRTTPLLPLQPDYREWNGKQFEMQISRLADSALADSVFLRGVPLRDYASVISQDGPAREYYPDLYAFALYYWSRLTSKSPVVTAPLATPTEIYFRLDKIKSYSAATFAELVDLYNNYLDPTTGRPESEYVGDILVRMSNTYSSEADELLLYNAIRTFLDTWKGYRRRGCLENTLAEITHRNVMVELPAVTGPGRETQISVTLRNVDRATIKIYNVSSISKVSEVYFEAARGVSLPAPVASLSVAAGEENVPFMVKRTLSYTFPANGTYVVIPDYDGAAPISRELYSKVYVTGISLASAQYIDRDIYAISPVDGAPLGGVSLTLSNGNRSVRRIGSTNQEGYLTLPHNSRGTLTAAKGADRYALPLYTYSSSFNTDDKWLSAVKGFSSLPIYHPADTVRWSAVLYDYRGAERRVCADKRVEAVLTDPSGMAIDTLSLTSDSYGRISGSFILPAESLQGRCHINIDGHWSAVSFMMANYKMPSFAITDTAVEQGLPDKGGVTLHGRVVTYSGFPLANCTLQLSLKANRRLGWWNVEQTEIYNLETASEADGSFSIPIKAALLDSVKAFDFTASLTATASNGESQAAQIRFATAERFYPRGMYHSACDITSGRLSVEASAVDWKDSVVNIPVNFRILKPDSTIVFNHIVTGGSGCVDLSSIPSGPYIFAYSLPDSISGGTDYENTVLYRTTDTETPVPGTLLWSPVSEITFDSDSTSTWLYATDCPTHLLVTVSDGTRLLYRRWHKVDAGLGHIAVSLPEGVESAVMSVAATGLYRSTQTTVRLTRPKLKKGIRLSAETIRDRVVPGGQEIWRLRVTDLSGRGREAAVIADMYNTALDALTSSLWTFSPLSGRQFNWNWNRPMLSSRTSIGRPAPYAKYKECPPEVSLQFNSYGRGWSSFGNRHVYRNMAMLKRDASDEVMIEEEIALDSAPMMATRSYASAQTKMMAGGMAMADDLAEAVNADAGEAEPTEAGDEPNREFAYRDSETPLAFFRPDLTTEADGSLALQFTLPDANTTWGFRAVAWTDSLLTALYSLDVIASKPLMVKPNAPRFIRSGDRVQIPALVMNATDSTITADVLVELFNPSDGLATTALRKTVTVQAGATDTVGIHLTAPSCGAFTGYRVKVSAEGWTDGEQMLIPILPSATPVIESLPFCIAPDSASVTLNIPAIPADGRRELQLCLNPVWYVVTALPGLLDNEASTAPEAARSLFSAAVARGLLAANPAIAEAMAEWSASDRDGAMLTSMLERNAELRNVLLAATPWMSDADSDTERMSRLALLLDSKTVNSVISSALNTLYNLWQGDGWSWCAQYPRSSEWASSQVLGLCGRLAELGMLPVDKKLRSMLAEALDADTRRELNIYTRHPHSDFTHYVMLHDLYRSLGIGTPASQLVDAALSHITADWKKSSLTDKARYAIILNNHNYTRTAGAILASIAEYARTTPELGTFFPSLSSDAIAATSMIMRAYLAVDPHSSAIDGIRQWLTRQKSMQNWGDSATTTDVIATFLTSSSRWLVPAGDATIMINNTEQTVSTASRLTGELSMAIPTGQTALYISRAGHTPASGAVYSIYTLPLSQIKGSACPELSIEKSLSRTLADGNIESVNEATTLHPGDKVTVTLTLRAAETMDYVIVTDCRAACFEPTEQLPAPVWSEGICFYRENRNSETRLFIDRLPKGIYKLSYTLHVNSAGTFTSGIATAQSQYAPRITSHTPATTLTSKF